MNKNNVIITMNFIIFLYSAALLQILIAEKHSS